MNGGKKAVMDERLNHEDGRISDPGVPEQRARVIRRPVRLGLTVVAFVVVAALVYRIAEGQQALTTEAQRMLYPLLSGFLIGGLTALWLYHQTASDSDVKPEPKPWFYPVLGGALTLALAALAFMFIGMWPVGNLTLMMSDMRGQYAPMLAQLRDMLLHGGSPLYSFEIGTGTSFIPLFSYYLASPLNLLLVLFPQAYLAEGILLITLIKIVLAGAFMTLCLQYIFDRRCCATVAVGVMYALMQYVIGYSWDIMWLDCVMFLPLCVMGFEHMMRTGKYLLYVLSLAYALYSNYYIGFMICIFLVLYYAAFLLREKRAGRRQALGFARFAVGSLLGGGLAMFLLVPVLLSLVSTSAASESLPAFGTNFPLFNLLGRSLLLTTPTVRTGTLPNIYCGVLAVLALPIFATMRSVPLRRRLAYLGLFGVMALSMVLNRLDLFWHGLHEPNDLPYRFAFLYAFALLLIAFEVLYRIREIRPAQLGGALLGIAVYLIVEEKFGTEGYSVASLYLSFGMIAVYAAVMLAAANRRITLRSAYLLTVLFVSVEMLINASGAFKLLHDTEGFSNHSAYLDNDVTEAITESINRLEEIGDAEMGGEFYRLEFLPRRTMVDTALFDYRGITVFASSGSYDMTRFMGSMGYNVNGMNRQRYRSFVPTCDSLLGIRYVAMTTDVTGHPQLEKLETVQVGSSKYHLYRNPYALPVGFMAKTGVKDWAYSYYNPMLSQNSLFEALTGNAGDVMRCQPVSADSDSVEISDGTAFQIRDAQTATFRSTVEERGQIYVFVDCQAAKSIYVHSGDSRWEVTPIRPFIIDVGTLDAGSEITVDVTTGGNCKGNVLVARLDEDAFVRDIASLAANGMTVTSFDDSSITGTVHAGEAGVLCTTVQYDDGWTVEVDGIEVETFAVGDALLAFDLQPGDHEIYLHFFPKGFTAGITMSAVSLVALVLLRMLLKRRERRGKRVLSVVE